MKSAKLALIAILALSQVTTQLSKSKFQTLDDPEGIKERLNITEEEYKKFEFYRLKPSDFISNLKPSPNPLSKDPQDPKRPSPYFPYDPTRGYIEIYPKEEGGDNSMWYWLFPARENPDTAPLVIWFAGGPGGSSTTDAFGFMGPFEFKDWPFENKKALLREYSWNQKANVIFPDFPLGVGFSTVTEGHVARSGEDVMEQIRIFYTKFLAKFPQYKKREVYLAGVSYGGHWAPYAAYALKYAENPDINVAGFLVDSGTMNATDMYSSYLKFAVKQYQYTGITQQVANALNKYQGLCSHYTIFKPNPFYIYTWFDVCMRLYYPGVLQNIAANKPRFSPYYMPGNAPPVDPSFLYFFNNRQAQDYLRVRKRDYQPLNNTIYNVFCPRDLANDMIPLMSRMLRDKVKGVVIACDYDFITNFEQSEKTVSQLDWSGRVAWNKKQLEVCEVGLCKELLNLREYRVKGAGHGVSAYKPKFGVKILNDMLDWKPAK